MASIISLDGLWDFRADPDDRGRRDGWAATKPDGCRPGLLPMPWNLLDASLFKYEGTVWFFRTVAALPPGDWALAGDGVNHRITAWADGEEIGSHEGGYLGFEFPLPQYTDNRPLRIALAVDNRLGPKTLPPSGADWLNWGGVVRRLCLRSLAAARLVNVNPRCTVDGSIVIEGHIAGLVADVDAVTARLLDAAGRIVWEASAAPAAGDGEFRIAGGVDRPKLWSPEDPALYDLVVGTAGPASGGDTTTMSVGFREIRAEACQILLNGEPLQLRGISRHEAHPHFGNAGIDQVAFQDLSLLKRAGANLVRLAHYPNDPRVMDMADRLGILVFADLPTIWLGEEQMADLEMLARCKATFDSFWRRDRHHPSLFLWGLMSECATETEVGERFFAELASHVRMRDPGRLITQASETPDGDRCFQYADVLGLNYFLGWYVDAPTSQYGEALDALHEKFPDKPILLSSHGADAIAGFRSLQETKWSEEAQAAYHSGVLAEVRRRPFVAGQSIWVLSDYQGPAWRTARFNPLNRPKEQNNKGLLDEYRRPKLAYDTVRSLYRAWAQD